MLKLTGYGDFFVTSKGGDLISGSDEINNWENRSMAGLCTCAD
jgi:hypothetical protein